MSTTYRATERKPGGFSGQMIASAPMPTSRVPIRLIFLAAAGCSDPKGVHPSSSSAPIAQPAPPKAACVPPGPVTPIAHKRDPKTLDQSACDRGDGLACNEVGIQYETGTG